MRLLPLALAMLVWFLPLAALAEGEAAAIVAENREMIEKPSRQTIGPVIEALAASGDPMAAVLLQAWDNKGLGLRKADGAFFLIAAEGDGYTGDRTRILDALSARTPRSTEDVAGRAGFAVDEAASLLGLLELEGLVVRRAMGWVQESPTATLW